MKPELNTGDFVFCTMPDLTEILPEKVIMIFKEREGYTIVLEKSVADKAGFDYSFIASWITLTVLSSLEAVGLTAAFSKALSENGISCNVVAAFYHDHIFVRKEDAEKAIHVLLKLSCQKEIV